MTDTQSQKEKHGFQTEVKELLHLMIHSLYSNKEVVLRELISNASDAADKIRFEALSNGKLLETDSELKITVDVDKESKLLTVSDNGIGMSRDEIVEHLGTIAKSGTKEFVSKLTGDQSKDSQLIGQFGVGFYSSFMIADKVTVISRRAGLKEDQAVRWESKGDGEYTVENTTKATRGTQIILHLKKGEEEYAEFNHVRSTILKYSDHISLPILMKEPESKPVEGEEAKPSEYAPVNKATALWTREKSEIKPEEYSEFYKGLSYDYQDPLCWMHNKVEGKQQFTTLLYIPKAAPFDLWDRERKSGLKLYIKRVFIMDNAELLPSYLRFMKGVIDSDDLPLNVSREILQNNKLVESIKSSCVKKTLQKLTKLAENDKEAYASFWKAFGNVIKEGPAEDMANIDKLSHLMRFASTHTDTDEQNVSLADYVSRMKDDQKHIYYIVADNHMAAKNSPHLELFRKKGIEVILMSDRVDEWLMAYMKEFEGKTFQSIAKGELEDDTSKEEKEKIEAESKDFESVLKQVKEVLGDKIEDVRLTHRLTDSPSCVVVKDDAMSMHLQRMIEQAGQEAPVNKPLLELNPEHALVTKLKTEADDDIFKDLTKLLFEQALLAEGGQLQDPASFVKRVNRFIAK